jgi:hypothetical protein
MHFLNTIILLYLKPETGLIINYPGLVLSNGSLKGIQVVSARSSEGIFSLHWKNQYDLRGEENVYLALLPTHEDILRFIQKFLVLEKKSNWKFLLIGTLPGFMLTRLL